jgi:flagellar assembly protein FliH
MIKAYSVRYDVEIKKTIDTHLRIDKELEVNRKIVLQTLAPQSFVPQDDFVEGLQVFMVDTLPAKEEITERSFHILEDAKNEAALILEQAKKEAQQLKNEAFTAAQKKGYEEGILQAKRELQKRNADCDEKESQRKKEYEAMMTSIEPQMVEIIAALVEKITGILVEDKNEVILYLVEKALKKMDKSEEYTIRVSKEDYEYISLRKNVLIEAIGREAPLNIAEDVALKKNMCLIETELRVINCSLDVQLNNLIMDLKLIGGI